MGTRETQDLAAYLEKPATPLQERFVGYLQEEVGYNPNAAKTKAEAFAEGVRLSTALRMVFQASDYNKKGRAELQRERAQAAPAPVAKAAPAKKAAAKKAAPAASEPAAQPAKKATRRRAAQPAVSQEEAPF